MAFNHDPNQAEEGGGFALLPVGNYTVKVIETEERNSKAGNAMVELVLEVQNTEHYKARLWDYLVEGHPFTHTKTAQVLTSCGLSQVAQSINADTFLGKIGVVHVKHDEHQGETRSKVSYWVTDHNAQQAAAAPAPAADAIATQPVPQAPAPVALPPPIPPQAVAPPPAAPAPAPVPVAPAPVAPPAAPPAAPAPVPPPPAPAPAAAPAATVMTPNGPVDVDTIPF